MKHKVFAIFVSEQELSTFLTCVQMAILQMAAPFLNRELLPDQGFHLSSTEYFSFFLYTAST